jgi:hypothetical protein
MPDGSHIHEAKTAAPARFKEQAFHELRFAEQFLVWSVRKWVDVMRGEEKDPAAIRDAFLQTKVGDAYEAFDFFMRILAASATRTIDVRCVHCRDVSVDESMILGMVEAGQRGDAVSTHIYLDEWIPAAAARIAFSPVSYMAEAMDRAGMQLSGNCDRHIGLHVGRAVH